jgi:hypothetical protein
MRLSKPGNETMLLSKSGSEVMLLSKSGSEVGPACYNMIRVTSGLNTAPSFQTFTFGRQVALKVMICICIREMGGWNVSKDTGYSD